jgi:hypothetical protein
VSVVVIRLAIIELLKIDGREAAVRDAARANPAVALIITAVAMAWLTRFLWTSWRTLDAPLPPDAAERTRLRLDRGADVSAHDHA